MGYRPIADYGAIGNDERCALVDRHGSIDWCCFPHVESPSVFAALLDDEQGGHFAVRPTASYDSNQNYRDRTNVLETRFRTRGGTATLTDFMPAGRQAEAPVDQQAIYRRFRCEEGRVTLEFDYKPRLDYGRAETRLDRRGRCLVAVGDRERLYLQLDGFMEVHRRNGRGFGFARLDEGEEQWFVLQYEHFRPVPEERCRQALEETTAFWREWANGLDERIASIVGEDPWHEPVLRSALVLKLLINERTGGIYAAPTTSLPEAYGGARNWDYRYNWIRDAKFTIQALFNLGRRDEAHAYFDWFRQASHEDPEDIQPVYGVHGHHDLTERHLEHLAGYRGSPPVRVGNIAAEQRQLDMYGVIVQGLYETLLRDGRITEEDWESIASIVNHVCDVWHERGEGIWELREESRHYVHSKLLCWVALDRGIELATRSGRQAPIEHWRLEQEALREAIEEQGYSQAAGSFVQHFETEHMLDATCLLIPIFDFLPPGDPRVEGTIDAIMDELLTDNGLVYRTQVDALEQRRGAFLLCSFWLVDALVLADRVDEAREIFTAVLEQMRSPLLLSERVDARTGEFLGNYPQAFSHIGLINSAIYLGTAREDWGSEEDPLGEDLDLRPLFRPRSGRR